MMFGAIVYCANLYFYVYKHQIQSPQYSSGSVLGLNHSESTLHIPLSREPDGCQ